MLRIWERFFYTPAFFTLDSFSIFATIPQVLRIWESFFYSQAFVTLHSFPTFATTWLYQGSPGSRQLFFEGYRDTHWGSKHRLGRSVRLNHTVFSKRYLPVGSIYVVRMVTGKKHHQIKLRHLQKVRIWAFGLLLHQINSIEEVLKLKQIFQKNEIVSGKLHSLWQVWSMLHYHFICLNIGFWYCSFVWK